MSSGFLRRKLCGNMDCGFIRCDILRFRGHKFARKHAPMPLRCPTRTSAHIPELRCLRYRRSSTRAASLDTSLCDNGNDHGSTVVTSRVKEAVTTVDVVEKPVTIIAFDIETTGFKASEDRIIEFAARDLAGGDRSTISALVNPGRKVPYFVSAITGITNAMVNRPHIPSWKEVGPIVLEFVESRRRGDGPVILVAHNGKRFDVPFLLREFQDCSLEVPEWWLFLDSMPLAREVKKRFDYDWASVKLSDVHKGYGLHINERAHRALADVHMLAAVLGLMVRDLEMPLPTLLDRSFTADDILSSSKFLGQPDKGVEESPGEERGGLEVPWEESVVELETLAEQESQEILSEEFDSQEILCEEFDSFLDTSSVDVSLLDPRLRQYVEIKKERPNFVHLVASGKYFEAFFEDAKTIGRSCRSRVTMMDHGKMQIPVIRVPASKANLYCNQLLSKGLNVVKQNQFGTGGRKIDAVLTPGMVLEDGVLDESSNLYVGSLMTSPSSEEWGFAYCDLSTGEFFATQGDNKQTMVQALGIIEPAELIMPLKDSVIDLACFTRPFTDFSALTNDSDLLFYSGHEVSGELKNWKFADCAAGALLRYIQQTQALTLEELPIRKLRLYSTKNHLYVDDASRTYLELVNAKKERSLLWAMDDTKTVMGSRMLRKWMLSPLLSVDGILKRLDAVELLMKNGKLRSTMRSYLSDVMDIERLVASIARASPLLRDDLLALSDSLFTIPKLCLVLEKLPRNPYFSAVLGMPTAVMDLAEEVQAMLGTNFNVNSVDGAGELLDGSKVRACKKWILDVVSKIKSGIHFVYSSLETSLQDGKGNRSPGDGDGVNGTQVACKSREKEVLEDLRKKVVHLLRALHETNEALAALDVLCSFAETAATRDYCRPTIVTEEGELTIVNGRHPVLEVGDGFTPNSCHLGMVSGNDSHRANVVVLTGECGSGKSSYLQQTGLIQVLAQCGSFVPAEKARLTIADAIFAFGQGASAANVLRNATKNSLVLLDEFKEAAQSKSVVSQAVIEFLGKNVRARAIVCKEGGEMQFEDDPPSVVNYRTWTMYAVTPGFSSPVDGIASVTASGYPEWVCNRVSELLHGNDHTTSNVGNGSLTNDGIENGGGSTLWNRIMNFTKVKPNSDPLVPIEETQCEVKKAKVKAVKGKQRTKDLDVLWQQVSEVLQNSPATLALTQQKGSLISISKKTQPAVVTIGTAPLFVRKFQQHEHAAALEAAFESILDQPVKLEVSEIR